MDKDTIKETVKNAPKKVKNIFSKENIFSNGKDGEKSVNALTIEYICIYIVVTFRCN